MYSLCTIDNDILSIYDNVYCHERQLWTMLVRYPNIYIYITFVFYTKYSVCQMLI